MAKYQASPHYDVAYGDKSIKFDWLGNYETTDAGEIEALDGLAPIWIKRIDEPKPDKPESQPEVTPEPKPATKAASKPKASAK